VNLHHLKAVFSRVVEMFNAQTLDDLLARAHEESTQHLTDLWQIVQSQ
jgi:hypothetical protein